jgi:hypothetical protein
MILMLGGKTAGLKQNGDRLSNKPELPSESGSVIGNNLQKFASLNDKSPGNLFLNALQMQPFLPQCHSIELNCCCYPVGTHSRFMMYLAIFRLVPFLSRSRHMAVSLLYYMINTSASCIKHAAGSLPMHMPNLFVW